MARRGLVPEAVAQALERIRPTSHAASAQPAPVKKPTQNQMPIWWRLRWRACWVLSVEAYCKAVAHARPTPKGEAIPGNVAQPPFSM